MKNGSKLKGIIYVVLASLCYGVTPILSSTALKGGLPADFIARVPWNVPASLAADPSRAIANESVVGISMLIACVFSLVTCLLGKKRLSVEKKQLWQLFVFGALGLTATLLLLTYSYAFVTPGIALVLNFVYPVIVLIISSLFFGERFSAARAAALAVAIIGILLISGVITFGASSGGAVSYEGVSPAPGILLALASAAAYAAYFLAGRHSAYTGLDTSVCNVYITGFSAVICLAAALLTGRFMLPKTPFLWLMLLGEGTLGMVLGLRLLLAGIRLLGSAPASALNTLEPVFVMITSAIVYGSAMNAPKLIGAALVLLAALVCILAMSDKKQAPSES